MNTADNTTYVLVVNEALFYGSQSDHSLFKPNQLRHNGVNYHDNPYDKYHRLSIDVDRGPLIPLKTHGNKILFDSRVSTNEELESCMHVQLILVIPWEPESVQLGEM